MKGTTMNNAKYALKTTVAFAAGIAIGYVANLFVSTEEREKQRQKLEDVKQKISTESLNDVTNSLFGKSAKDMKQEMDTLLDEFHDQVDSVRETADSFDARKYQRLVNDFVSKVQEDRDFSNSQVEKLKSFLKSDYQKVMQIFNK